MKKETPVYSIGLDIGTNSVGWAVIDSNYNLLRLCGRDAWGVLLFENAKTAAGRRLARSARRRMERRKERIRLLREIFAPLIAPEDENFFLRLDESSLHVGEGEFFRKNRYNIFDGDHTDKDYFAKAPTIYHLRKKLMDAEEKADIRLVYLAVHHIVKYRGHFLLEGSAANAESNMLAAALKEFFELAASDEYGKDMGYDRVADDVLSVLRNKRLKRAFKRKDAAKLFAASGYKKYADILLGAILGYNVKLSDLLDIRADKETTDREVIIDDDGSNMSFAFSDGKYDENEEKYLQAAEERADIFLAAKKIYSAIILDGIMRGKSTLSAAMIDKYEKHAKDLRTLKKLFREHLKEDYNSFFRKSKGASYTRYIGDKSYGVYKDKTSQEDLYKELRKLLAKVPECAEKEYCVREMDNDDLFPLINSVANAHIPYQLNAAELSAILDCQGRFYPQLLEEKDKIMSLLTFRRPYYVGPLKGDKFGWNTQSIEGRVTPWNFYEKVDTDALAEGFIMRMTNKCRIFPEEEALPKNSIVWQAYCVFNEINKLRVGDRPISVECKKEMFEDLCCRKRKVRAKDIAVFLSKRLNESISAENVRGLSGDALTSGMETYIEFKSKLGPDFDMRHLDAYEESIRTLTIFDDIEIRKKRLKAQRIYTDNQIVALARLKYKGWGSYSRRVLRDTRSIDGKNIMELLYDTNRHFNELIYDDKLGFKQQFIQKQNEIERYSYDDVKDMRCSPIVRKAVWNALRLAEELVDIVGGKPKYIFIEDTHEEDAKRKKDPIVAKLLKLYNTIKDEEYFDEECYEKLSGLDKDKRLPDDALYLWLTQLGRCMYSGDKIEFDEIRSCQIDHIVPRFYLKDDGLSNRVLVKTIENQRKSDTLGISHSTIARMKTYWEFLFKNKLISAKKFYALQKTEYTDADRDGFVQRQLVDTSYAVKQIRELLSRRFTDTQVRGIRAGLNSLMRQRYQDTLPGFYKLRRLNNFHHAKDAYLTAVLGQFTSEACPFWGNDKSNRILKRYISDPSNTRQRVHDLVNRRYGIVLDLFASDNSEHFLYDDNGEFLWDETRRGNVFATMAKNTCNAVKKQEPFANSEFYDQKIYSPRSDKKELQPLKYKNGVPMPTKLYGGYSSLNPAYFVIVEKDKKSKKGGRELVFGMVPVIVQTVGNVEEYIRQKYGENAVIRRIVRKFQPLIYKGQYCFIAGVDELQNAVEMYVSPKFEKLLYLAEQRKKTVAAGKNATRWDREYDADKENNDALFDELLLHFAGKIERFCPLYVDLAQKLRSIVGEMSASITTEEKLCLLLDIMTVTQSGPGRAKLNEKFGNREFGRLPGKTVYPDRVTWIDISLTGLRRRERHEEL